MNRHLLDRALAALCLMLLLPVLVAGIIAIQLDDPGSPVLFRQQRKGKDGRPFIMLKLRTMYVGAEDRPSMKSRTDARVTPSGRWLRKYSIDELPQLVNVIRGDMAMVGPRPLIAGEPGRISTVLPGITGLWQIGGRSDLSWDERGRLDAQYVAHRSLYLDAMILVLTVPAVIKARGAY